MLVFYFQLAVVVIVVVGVAILIGNLINKQQREIYCPYCCCREHCRVGQGVKQKCPDEALKPFVCGGNF